MQTKGKTHCYKSKSPDKVIAETPFSLYYPIMPKPTPKELTADEIDRVIEMAWEDRTPFDAIKAQFGIDEAAVIALMRRELKPQSWRRWRIRVAGRATKHAAKRDEDVQRFRCSRQKAISRNAVT